MDHSDEVPTNDPKYKQFNEEINTVLSLFSKSTEWADFIKCLVKFNKVFEKFPKSTYIQNKLMISKRLSQCLNPSLPSGCHIKGLESYEVLFGRIGQEKLSKDISIYATGLFPLYHLASTDVRVKILQLYEKFILPLGMRLISCLNGVVSSILPGLEEGSGDAFEQVIKLLDSFCKATSTTDFYQAIWKSLITTPYNRLSALQFLLNRLPKDMDITHQVMFLPEKDTLVARALSNSLLDSNILVQRNILELITIHFPLSTNVFVGEPLDDIVKSAIMVVTHKDMSLNRRLYSWLLGPGESNTYKPEYFEKYSRRSTINSFKEIFKALLDSSTITTTTNSNSNSNSNNQNNNQITKPFRILIYLFQKDEFQVIFEDILLDILKCIFIFKDGYPFSKDIIRLTDELLESMSNPGVIWNFFGRILSFTLENQVTVEMVKLVECILDIMNLLVEDVQTIYLPTLLLSIIKSMPMVLESKDNQLIISYTQISLKIIGKIVVDTSATSLNNLLSSIEVYQEYFIYLSDYITRSLPTNSLSNTTSQSYPVSQIPSSSLNISSSLSFTPSASSMSSYTFITNTDIFMILDLSLQMLFGLLSQFKTSSTSPLLQSSGSSSPLFESSLTPKWYLPILNFCTSENPYIACLAIKTFIMLANKHGDSTNLSKSLKGLVISNEHFQLLAKKLWSLLDPNHCAVHYKVASLYYQLRELNEDAVSSTIAEAMLNLNLKNRVEGFQKFALLWRLTSELGNSTSPFSKTMFLMFDSLHDDQPIIRLTGHTWLADSISRVERILDPLLRILLDKSTIRFNNTYQVNYDTGRVIYAFKILKAIIECDFKSFIQHVIEKPISKDVLQLNEQQSVSYRESKDNNNNNKNNNSATGNNKASTSPNNDENTYVGFASGTSSNTETSSDFLFIPTNSYIDLLVVVSLRFIQGQVPNSFDHTNNNDSFIAQNDVVQICSAEFLQYLLAKTTIQTSKSQEIANYIQEPILQNLAQAVSTSNMVLQVHLLSLLRLIVLIDSSTTSSLNGIVNNANLQSPPLSFNNNITTDVVNPGVGSSLSLSSITQSQMFLQTTVVGLIQPSTRFNIRFYWLDFITFCLPRMSTSPQLPHVVLTIVNCLRDLLGSFDNRSLYDSLTARDIVVILKSLTFILKFSILEPITPFEIINNEETQRSALGVRMFDFVKDVFTSEIDNKSLTPLGQVRKEIFNILPDIISPLLRVWGLPKSTSTKISISTDVSSDTHNKFAIQDLIIHIFDPLMSKYPSQFIESMVDLWQKHESLSTESQVIRRVIMEVINSLDSVKEDTLFTATYQILIQIHAQDKTKTPKTLLHKLNLKEAALYDFVGKYIDEYSTPFDGVSNPFLFFVKESIHSSNPMTFVSQLQILNTYTKKLIHEDKTKNPTRSRLNKRELQDLLPKIIDACFMISGKSFNDISAMYIPPLVHSNSTTTLLNEINNMNGNNSSVGSNRASTDLPVLLQTPPSAYTSASTSIGEDTVVNSSTGSSGGTNNSSRNRTSSGGEHSESITPNNLKREASRLKTQVSLKSLMNLSGILASLLDSILDDKERIATLLANSLHNIVPYLKIKPENISNIISSGNNSGNSTPNSLQSSSSPSNSTPNSITSVNSTNSNNNNNNNLNSSSIFNRENSYYATCLFASLSEYTYNLKSIKKDGLELFFDSDFFKNDIKTLEQSSKFLNQIMIHDKTALSDFTKTLGKAWNPASNTIFVNKETENLNRARQLKRLSFIIWSGSENQYLSILALVQEKIVESLRIPNATILHLQVFLCLRVLLMKISHQNLRSFWPIILTELIDTLSHSDNSELILAACKFLDLALTLPSITEQFNLFEWVFIKDCFVKHSQEPPFLPFIDQIAQKPIQYSPHYIVLTPNGSQETNDSPTLRPCILIKSIPDLHNGFPEFKAFLSRFSSTIYHRHMLSSRPVDYQFINEFICFDFSEIGGIYFNYSLDLLNDKNKSNQSQIQNQNNNNLNNNNNNIQQPPLSPNTQNNQNNQNNEKNQSNLEQHHWTKANNISPTISKKSNRISIALHTSMDYSLPDDIIVGENDSREISSSDNILSKPSLSEEERKDLMSQSYTNTILDSTNVLEDYQNGSTTTISITLQTDTQ